VKERAQVVTFQFTDDKSNILDQVCEMADYQSLKYGVLSRDVIYK